jgi:hypothetical protein
MMARNTNVPFKGRIQKRKTYHLQIITFRLQRAAGPYRSARSELMHRSNSRSYSTTSSARTSMDGERLRPSDLAVFVFNTNSNLVGPGSYIPPGRW